MSIKVELVSGGLLMGSSHSTHELPKNQSSPPLKELLPASTVMGGEPAHTQRRDQETGKGKRATGRNKVSVTTPSLWASPSRPHTTEAHCK